MRFSLLLILIFIAAPLAQADTFTVAVKGNRSPGAILYLAVYSGHADDWAAQPIARQKTVLPSEPNLTIDLELAPGQYALRAFVDLDQDGILAINHKDRPEEPFASSVGAGRYNPSVFFSRSVFIFDQRRPHTELELRYPEGTGLTAQ